MLTISFNPFPVLHTKRLRLRRIGEPDAQQMFKLRSDPETMRFVPRPLAKTIEDANDHIRMITEKINTNTGINWAITLADDDTFIGIIGLFRFEQDNFRSELGYMILPEFQNQGIVSESIGEVLKYGFDKLKLHSIEAIIDPENYASAKVLEKNGFLKEAHLRQNQFFDGKFLDTVIYSKLTTD